MVEPDEVARIVVVDNGGVRGFRPRFPDGREGPFTVHFQNAQAYVEHDQRLKRLHWFEDLDSAVRPGQAKPGHVVAVAREKTGGWDGLRELPHQDHC